MTHWPSPFRTALVLGGGGARGLAHIGAITALEEDGFRPDLIVGTSAGAIAGGAYACLPDAAALRERAMDCIARGPLRQLEDQFKQLTDPVEHGFGARVRDRIRQAKRLMLYNRQAMRHALIQDHVLAHLAHGMVGDAQFDQLAIPFCAVACDLAENRRVVFGEGSVASALMASGAIPGVFEPVTDDGHMFVDGCVLDLVPCEVARLLGADFVVAVDIGLAPERVAPRNAADILTRVSDLRGERLRRDNLRLADVVIAPNVAGIDWMEVSKSDQAFAAGRSAVHTHRHKIQQAMSRERWRSLPRRWFRRAHASARLEIAHIAPRSAEEWEETSVVPMS
jgi:NTE family protein